MRPNTALLSAYRAILASDPPRLLFPTEPPRPPALLETFSKRQVSPPSTPPTVLPQQFLVTPAPAPPAEDLLPSVDSYGSPAAPPLASPSPAPAPEPRVREGEGRCMVKVDMVESLTRRPTLRCEHKSEEKCHLTYITAFQPSQQKVCQEHFEKSCTIIFQKKATPITSKSTSIYIFMLLDTGAGGGGGGGALLHPAGGRVRRGGGAAVQHRPRDSLHHQVREARARPGQSSSNLSDI